MGTRKTCAVVTALTAIALTGCNSRQAADGNLEQAASGMVTADPNTQGSKILAAAEPFEALTEQAPSATAERQQTLITDAWKAAAGVSTLLEVTQLTQLEEDLGRIYVAKSHDDRVGIALAAVEGYRTLVESARSEGPVPRAVSLLDYAGFRYQADLASDPARWSDAIAAVDYANERWTELEDTVSDKRLKNDFGKALADMSAAARVRDTNAAMRSVRTELDLVDQLESHFANKPGS